MSTVIAEYVAGCFEAFRSISAITVDEPQGYHENPERKIQNELSRFKVWSGNIGAHQRGRSSLDYRLRDASHVTSQVTNLLIDLETLLRTACSILDGTRLPWDQETSDIEDEEDGDISGPEEGYIGFKTELDQITADVVEVINCLMKLSASIRNPAPHDRFRGSFETNTSYYEPSDIAHVRAKYENADPGLAELLGKANSRRRQYFKYRKSHHQKLTQNLDLDHDSGKTVADGQSTVASSIPLAMKNGALGDVEPVDIDKSSDSGFTQTSYTPSADISAKPWFPALPSDSADGPFECPFCFMIITVTTSYAWRKHVFADLRPYSCVTVDCPIAGAQFARRHQWMEHMLQSHWCDWHCPFCDNERFPCIVRFQEHLSRKHAGGVHEGEVKAMVNLCERPRPFDRDTKCPICQCSLESVRQYRHHVGRHLEDIAIFVLPQISDDDDLFDEETKKEDIERDTSVTNGYHIKQEGVKNTPTDEELSDTASSVDVDEDRHVDSPITPGPGKYNLTPNDDSEEGAPKKYLPELEAELETKEREAKQREMETKIREEAEALFQRKLRDMRREEEIRAEERLRALDQAKKELEDARQEAEMAALEAIEAERRAEAERKKVEVEAEDAAKRAAESQAVEDDKSRTRLEIAAKIGTERMAPADKAATEEAASKKVIEGFEQWTRAEEEATELARKKAAEEIEWRKNLEEEAKLKAELEARRKIEAVVPANKAAAEEAARKKAVEESEWRKRVEEEARLKAELEARMKIEVERVAAADAAAAEEAARKKEAVTKIELRKYVEENAYLKADLEARRKIESERMATADKAAVTEVNKEE